MFQAARIGAESVAVSHASKSQARRTVSTMNMDPLYLTGQTLRDTVHAGLQNLGILSAFMTALSGQVYIDAPSEPQCFGIDAVKTQLLMMWMSMGFFFFSMATTVLLAFDLDGIPNQLLVTHLRRSRFLYSLPGLCTLLGIILMCTGYGIDVGERMGCAYSLFGFVAAPMFAVAVISVAVYTKYLRSNILGKASAERHGLHTFRQAVLLTTQQKRSNYGNSWFTTWADRLPPFKNELPKGDVGSSVDVQ